jgi:hypothetical protein
LSGHSCKESRKQLTAKSPCCADRFQLLGPNLTTSVEPADLSRKGPNRPNIFAIRFVVSPKSRTHHYDDLARRPLASHAERREADTTPVSTPTRNFRKSINRCLRVDEKMEDALNLY